MAIMMLIKTMAKMNAFVEFYDVQGSASCAILPSRIGECVVSWENVENMKKWKISAISPKTHYL